MAHVFRLGERQDDRKVLSGILHVVRRRPGRVDAPPVDGPHTPTNDGSHKPSTILAAAGPTTMHSP